VLVVLVVDVVGVVGPYDVELEVVVMLDETLLDVVVVPAQEQPVKSGLMFCA
jgi:hypothetical protein